MTDYFINQSLYIFFSNNNVIAFKIVPLDSYTPMETLFTLLVVALEVFNRYADLLFDRRGIFHTELFPPRQTVNQVFFIKTSLKGSEEGHSRETRHCRQMNAPSKQRPTTDCCISVSEFFPNPLFT